MKVKNIMFSGIMAAILAGPALAADPVVATVASTGYVDAKVGVNAAAIAENTEAIADNTAAIAEKASQADLDTAEAAITALQGADTAMDTRVTAAETAITNLGTNKADKGTKLSDYGITDAYTKGETDTAIADAVKGTMEGDVSAALGDYLKKTEAESIYESIAAAKATNDAQDTKITANTGDLTTLKGNESVEGSVAQKISSAITALDLANTYAAKSVVETNTANIATLQGAVDGLDSKYATDTALGEVDAKFANYTTTAVLNTTLDTFATKTALKAEEDARIAADNVLSGKQDALTEVQLAAVNSGINAEKVAAYDNYATTKQDVLSGTGYVTINQETKTVSVTADGAVAADNTGLVTGGTVYTYALPKPTDCTEAKCVLSVDGNGAPYWMKLELAPGKVEG